MSIEHYFKPKIQIEKKNESINCIFQFGNIIQRSETRGELKRETGGKGDERTGRGKEKDIESKCGKGN